MFITNRYITMLIHIFFLAEPSIIISRRKITRPSEHVGKGSKVD